MRTSIHATLCLVLLFAGTAAAQSRQAHSKAHGEMNALIALVVSDLMQKEVDELVVKALPLARTMTEQVSNALRVRKAISYRVIITRREGAGKVIRLFLAVWFENMSVHPWTPTGVTLSAKGETLKDASVWESEPLPPGEEGVVLVEAVATEAQSRGTFTLTLRDESGGQFITLGKVTFP